MPGSQAVLAYDSELAWLLGGAVPSAQAVAAPADPLTPSDDPAGNVVCFFGRRARQMNCCLITSMVVIPIAAVPSAIVWPARRPTCTWGPGPLPHSKATPDWFGFLHADPLIIPRARGLDLQQPFISELCAELGFQCLCSAPL